MFLRLLRLEYIRWWPRTSLPPLRTLLVGRSLEKNLNMFVRLLSKLSISKSWMKCIHLYHYHSYRPVAFSLISDYLVTSTSLNGPGPTLDDEIKRLSWFLKRVVAAKVIGCTLLPQTSSSFRHIVHKTVVSATFSVRISLFQIVLFLFVRLLLLLLPTLESIRRLKIRMVSIAFLSVQFMCSLDTDCRCP